MTTLQALRGGDHSTGIEGERDMTTLQALREGDHSTGIEGEI
jgi:hypothetical protein